VDIEPLLTFPQLKKQDGCAKPDLHHCDENPHVTEGTASQVTPLPKLPLTMACLAIFSSGITWTMFYAFVGFMVVVID
jgi:hypothetical protein